MSQDICALIWRHELARGKTIGFVAFPEVEMLDVCGPLDVFSRTNYRLLRTGKVNEPVYHLEVLATQPGPVATQGGVQIVADRAYQEIDGGLDTLIVAGGDEGYIERACQDQALLDWLARMAPQVRRMASVCTGAFLLAASGLLNGRRATTHWNYSERLARVFPAIQVEPDLVFIRDGQVYTSGGITSGIDLALALVEEDHGRDVAASVARFMVMFLRRPGGQSQFSTYLTTEASNRRDIRELQAWILGHPNGDLSVEALSERMVMSPRNFARVFVKETGMTPAKFVERTRLEATRSKLEQTVLPIEAIAEQCGFGNTEHLRRSFQRVLKVSPQDYRARFRSTVLH